MKTWIWELVRIGFLAIVTAGLQFALYPWLFSTGTIALTDVDVDKWVSEDYTRGAITVFAVSSLSALVWYGIAITAQTKGSSDVSRNRWLWYFLLFLTTASIGVGVYLTGSSQEARWWLIPLFGICAFLIFWIGTAVSSPRAYKFVPLGSFFLRRLIGG